MRNLILVAVLAPALALAAPGDYVPGNSTLPGPWISQQVCPFANPNACWTSGNANTLRDALNDLRSSVLSGQYTCVTPTGGGSCTYLPNYLGSPIPPAQGGLGVAQPTCSSNQFLKCNGTTCACTGLSGTLDPAVAVSTASLNGIMLGRTVYASNGSGTFTTSAKTHVITVTVVGGGGAGGSGSVGGGAGGTYPSAGAGGGGGACAFKRFVVSPSTGYSYTVGAGGVSGGAAAGASSFAVGGVTVTANGGSAGTDGPTVSATGLTRGGPGGSATNGDLNATGNGGTSGAWVGSLAPLGGTGGGSCLGGGGVGNGSGSVGSNGASGGGGGGGAGDGTYSYAGGSGGAGAIIVDEWP